MQWLVTNWLWVLIGIAFIAMHLFGHGGHGGSDRPQHDDAGDAEGTPEPSMTRRAGGHQH